ncbi:hypothetical protein GF412_05230 [Candidatus Micrarchaeota archaeon]|nr:hypothetical protein [Candidatus Micrarchaeota archaeon]MBD3418356.1 hypothetical protein [Candidatus Micrarchaeota archaeon]
MSRRIDNRRLNFVINKASQPLKRAHREFSRAKSKLVKAIEQENEKTDRFIYKIASSPSSLALNGEGIDRGLANLVAVNKRKFLAGAFEEKLEGAYAGVWWSTNEAKDRFSEWTDDQGIFIKKVEDLHSQFLQFTDERYMKISDGLAVIDPKLLDQMIDAHMEMMHQLGEIARMTAHLGVAASIFGLPFPQRQKAAYGGGLENLPEKMEKEYPGLSLISIAAQGKERVAEALLEMLYPGESGELLTRCFAVETRKVEVDGVPERKTDRCPAPGEEMEGLPAPAQPQKPEISKSEAKKKIAEILSPSLGENADRGAKMCLRYLEREEWAEILEAPENLARVVHRHPELHGSLDKIKETLGKETEEMPQERNGVDLVRALDFSDAVKNEIKGGGMNIRDVKKAIIYGFKLASAKKAIGRAYFPSAVIEGNVKNAMDDGRPGPGPRANEILEFLKSHGVVSTDKNGETMMINTVESKGQAHPITPVGDEILSAIKKWLVDFKKETRGKGS